MVTFSELSWPPVSFLAKSYRTVFYRTKTLLGKIK